MVNIKNIVKGWGNYIADEIGILDQKTQKLSVERLNICDKCLLRSGMMCNPNRMGKNIKTGQTTFGCGCVLVAKTKVKEAECPLNKW